MQERIGFEKDTGEMRRRAVQKGLSEPAFASLPLIDNTELRWSPFFSSPALCADCNGKAPTFARSNLPSR